MSNVIKGNVSGTGQLKGSVYGILGKDGYSAYEIAVNNGFEGTEAEWLASLKGEKGADGTMTFSDLTEEQKASLKGDPGVYVGSGDMPDGYFVQIDPNGEGISLESIVAYVAEKVNTDLNMSANARIGEVELRADAWVGTNSPYSQRVSIPTVTPNTQVDLTPSVEQLSVFHHKDLAFVTENDGGAVTVYAIGQKPENDYKIQVTMTEVAV